MANDNETLTFRIRAIAENMGAFKDAARAAEGVNDSMKRSAKLAEALTGANRKLTAARDKESDAIGRMRVAEEKLSEVRNNSKAKLSQIAAAEERVATARRNAARATSAANKVEDEFQKLARRTLENNSQQSGTRSGRSWLSGFTKFFKGGSAKNDFEETGGLVGKTFGTGIFSGLQGLLKTQGGPYLVAGLAVAVALEAPSIGAVLAGGIVAGFGAGITALAVVFAAKSAAVKDKWAHTMEQMGADMKLFARPFEGVLIHAADAFQGMLDKFSPSLRTAFASLAKPATKFVDAIVGALERLIPAIGPITTAFEALLDSLGPGLDSMIHQIADGLIDLSDSVSRNPTGLRDLVDGVGRLTNYLLKAIGVLNDANGAFERLTGGTSLVKVTFYGIEAAINAVIAPLIIMAKYIIAVSDAYNALTHSTEASGQSMSDAANKTVALAQNLQKTREAAHGTVGPMKSVHDIAMANAKAAAAAKKAFEDWIDQLFRLQQLNISVAESQIALKNSIAEATQAAKENGKATSQNTQKGRDNWEQLLKVAKAANTQTEALIRDKASMVAVNAASAQSKAAFIKLAIQMGFNSKTAQKMAKDMIAIPNVTRVARLNAIKTDLDTKLAAAKRQLADPNLTKERRAKLNADIAKLTAALKTAQAKIDALHGKTVKITYTASGIALQPGQTIGTLRGKGAIATGGKISGPGTGTSDTAGMFALSNNEYVVKASSAKGYGDKAMASVNAGTATIIPGMAKGGPVVDIHTQNAFKSMKQARSFLDRVAGNSIPGGGKGVQKWRGVALQALALAHEPAAWIGSLLSRMQRESGGNPRAINLWDSNAKAGTPSIGLMQVIGPTFARYANGLAGRGIYDPLANIFAAIRYTVARYGSGPAGWNKAGGYKNGGWLMPGQLAYNETRRPEAVFNQQQLGAMNRPIIVQFMLDGKMIQQSLLKLNRDKGYVGLGFGRGEGHR